MRLPDELATATPLNLALDGPTLADHGREIAALQRCFAPLHEAAGTLP